MSDPADPSMSNRASNFLIDNPKVLAMLLDIAEICAPELINAFIPTPSTFTSVSLVGPMSWYNGSGL